MRENVLNKYKVGDMVFVTFDWIQGKVYNINSNGTYDLKFPTEVVLQVPESDITGR